MMEKKISWNSGGGYITLTYSGEGNDTAAVTTDENGGVAREQTISIQTTNGAVAKNVTVKQAACPVLVGDVKNFAYTGAVQSIELPKGKYKLQCWGAQGGSNAAYSSYGITSQTGGKGGYSEGVVTLTQTTTLYIFVGGQGSSSGNGGWNGGGGGTGISQYKSGGTLGYTKVGCGGGATDISLVTSSMAYNTNRYNERSAASLQSRIIVAGGGGGGAMTYRAVTTSTTTYKTLTSTHNSQYIWSGNYIVGIDYTLGISGYADSGFAVGDTLRVRVTASGASSFYVYCQMGFGEITQSTVTLSAGVVKTFTVPSGTKLVSVQSWGTSAYPTNVSVVLEKAESGSSTTTSTAKQTGYAGGGVNGAGFNSGHYGRPNAAGNGGGFGYGAPQWLTNKRHYSGLGGGGWYGGGANASDTDISAVGWSGGGSGFVNTAANASYRPSGYTGLQLDSGTTTAGDSSFVSTASSVSTSTSGAYVRDGVVRSSGNAIYSIDSRGHITYSSSAGVPSKMDVEVAYIINGISYFRVTDVQTAISNTGSSRTVTCTRYNISTETGHSGNGFARITKIGNI